MQITYQYKRKVLNYFEDKIFPTKYPEPESELTVLNV